MVCQQSRRPIFRQNRTIRSHTVITCSRHIERKKKYSPTITAFTTPHVAREHGTAQEPPRSQPLIQLSPLGMERSLATETSRKRILQAFSRARWLYAMDGVVTCNERVREVGWKRGARVYVLVERSWYTGAPKPPRTTAGSATPLAACRRIPTTAPRPHHGSRFESREKWVEKLYGVWSADYWTGTGRKDVSDSIYTAWIPCGRRGIF